MFFGCFFYRFSWAEFKSDNCQLWAFLYIQGQSQFQDQVWFEQMKLGTSVIPHFHVILTKKSISEIILIIQGHIQGQKVNFKVK